jgi:hypothetical protein
VSIEPIKPGLYEALLTRKLAALLESIQDGPFAAELAPLHEAEASDRVSRHVAALVAHAIERAPEGGKRDEATRAAAAVIRALDSLDNAGLDLRDDELAAPVEVLVSRSPEIARWPATGSAAPANPASRHDGVHQRTR